MTSTYQFLTYGNTFVTFDQSGDILDRDEHGLFVADTRHLSRYHVRPENLELRPLRSGSSDSDYEFFSTNKPTEEIHAQLITVRRKRTLNEQLTDHIAVHNFADGTVRLTLVVEFDADFADIFEIRGLAGRPDHRQEHAHCSRGLTIKDGRRPEERNTSIVFNPRPYRLIDKHAEFNLSINSGDAWTLDIAVSWHTPRLETGRPVPAPTRLKEHSYLKNPPKIETDDPALSYAFRQATQDMNALEIPLDSGYSIPAAGLPWYQTIFGRDSLIASLQSILLGPDIARGTLHTLAAYQSTDDDEFRDAEPGKMPHEIRFGELALTDQIPHARYYGTADATSLWIMLLRDYSRWTGDLNTVSALMPHAERALEWIISSGDLDGEGFVEYQRRSPQGQLNQGWKDSRGSIRFADGSIAGGPIALVEVQGYVYAAKVALSDIYEELGQPTKSHELRIAAERLRSRIDDAFWMPNESFYALALDGAQRQVDSITSNPGHLLWCGVPDPERARIVADKLMSPDLFSGWGIRTMSTGMSGYNPVSYHNGSVWPHDNSIILAGFGRYRFENSACRLANAMIEATEHFPDARLPELFCGFSRESTPFPVDYPTSCSPQAWSAGAIILLTQVLAGITPGIEKIDSRPLDHGRKLVLRHVGFRGRRFDIPCDS
jgi:glycogen debranching enzyme